ncbi:MAG: NAD(P)/FAD-dependent oxidoreductase [Chitinophagaceae bacterium]
MQEADIIVVGAGACGLMAARMLSKAGKRVAILEARDRTGGRIHTVDNHTFSTPTESGAEFIHGELPVTIGLLKEAGIKYHAIEGELWRHDAGSFMQEENFVEGRELLILRLQELKEDTTVAAFLDQFFSDEKFASLRNSVKGYVEGYDAADTTKASAFAFRDEWSADEISEQFRPNGGYHHLVQFMENDCRQSGCAIHLSSVVKEIRWQPGQVVVFTDKHTGYSAKKIIISVPLGIMQATPLFENALCFHPAIPEKIKAFQLLGFGAVIKILLNFREAFWKDGLRGHDGKNLKSMGWLFSAAEIPTWWTQLPDKSSLLTGWLAGPRALKMKDLNDEQILDKTLRSLSEIFEMSVEELSNNLSDWRVNNWTADPFTLGAYAYSTLETHEAIKIVTEPVGDTLFFAGEALHDGARMGTVEGALASGQLVVKQVLG